MSGGPIISCDTHEVIGVVSTGMDLGITEGDPVSFGTLIHTAMAFEVSSKINLDGLETIFESMLGRTVNIDSTGFRMWTPPETRWLSAALRDSIALRR